MQILFCLVAGLATTTALAVQPRDTIPKPAPASAYLKASSNNRGKTQPPIAREPPGGLNSTINPAKIPNARPAKEQSLRLAACAGPVTSNPASFWMTQMDHTGSARGYAPFLWEYYEYPTWRNVLDSRYGARNDGSGDQTAALQFALNDNGRGGNRYGVGVTSQPAHVFLPGGTYTLGSQLDLRRGTIIMGDPQNPPIIKASPGFQGEILIRGHDFTGDPTVSFLISMRNVILDTTAIDRNRKFTALQWGVAQGCSLGNIKINMPSDSAGHTGIWLENGSTIIVADLQITGGAFGIQNSNQQVNFKNIYFKYCRTAYAGTGGWSALLQKVTFDTVGLGIDLTLDPGRQPGSVVLLDSTSINSGTTVKFRESSPSDSRRNNQVLIQNFRHDNGNPIAVTVNGVTKLGAQDYVDTWTWGNAVPGQFQEGVFSTTTRAAALLDANGDFFTKDAPTYAGYALDQFINVKNVPNLPVKGDGGTDDSANLNAILAQAAAACKIVYFPFGSYVVKSTLFIPANSRIVGEAWPVISGAGDRFKNPNSPQPVVKVGNPGDIGIAHISDMRISPAEPLPGAIMLEVNIAGANKGDVGIWNTQVMFGGTADTTIKDVCTNQDTTNCRAAYLGVHLTPSSSVYVQNLWVWTADHNLDGGSGITIISTGRGLLVESTKATWLVGTGAEHNWLYNYNFNQAQNLFAGLMQVETPYMQGADAVLLAPAPWVASLQIGDPDFHWCEGWDGRCRSSVGNNINGGSNLFLYNSAAWAFFNGPWDGQYAGQFWCTGNCITNMNRVSGQPTNMYWYSIATKSADTLIFDSKSNPKELNNPGGWGGNLQTYREFA